MTLEKQRLLRLYALQEQLDEEEQYEDAAVVRWAIFELERRFGIRIGELNPQD